jgi:hypothetical protein
MTTNKTKMENSMSETITDKLDNIIRNVDEIMELYQAKIKELNKRIGK